MICSFTPSGMVQQPTLMERIREILEQTMEYVAGTHHSLISGIYIENSVSINK